MQELPHNELGASNYHRAQLEEQGADTNNLPQHTIDDVLSGVVYTDERQRVSLLLGIEAETRTRTFTFRANHAIVLDPEEIPEGDVQWVSVHPSTSRPCFKGEDSINFSAGRFDLLGGDAKAAGLICPIDAQQGGASAAP